MHPTMKVHMSKRIANIDPKKLQNSKPTGQLTHEQIAERARAIYEQSGRMPGRDLDNWLMAEAQLRDGRAKSLNNTTAH